jgi:hypothetical protein
MEHLKLLSGHVGLGSKTEEMSLLLSAPVGDASVHSPAVIPDYHGSILPLCSDLGLVGIADQRIEEV